MLFNGHANAMLSYVLALLIQSHSETYLESTLVDILIFVLDVVWWLFRWPLGPSWGCPGTLLVAFWGLLGPLGAVLGSSWQAASLFGNSWGHLARQSAQDTPKTA